MCCISLTFGTNIASVSFLQDTSTREHTLGNIILEALLFSLCVSGESQQDVAKQLAAGQGWSKASQMRLVLNV